MRMSTSTEWQDSQRGKEGRTPETCTSKQKYHYQKGHIRTLKIHNSNRARGVTRRARVKQALPHTRQKCGRASPHATFVVFTRKVPVGGLCEVAKSYSVFCSIANNVEIICIFS